jgi:hypothetical protein
LQKSNHEIIFLVKITTFRKLFHVLVDYHLEIFFVSVAVGALNLNHPKRRASSLDTMSRTGFRVVAPLKLAQ